MYFHREFGEIGHMNISKENHQENTSEEIIEVQVATEQKKKNPFLDFRKEQGK